VAEAMATVLRALADPLRLQIASVVSTAPTGRVPAGEIASITELTAPTVSHHLRSLREAQVDARRMLDATEAALHTDAALLSAAELSAIRKAMFTVGDMLETEAQVDELRAATVALGAVTDEFAARRMNASISKALAGQTMDSLA
jgi:molecular chaperone HscA